MSEPITGELGDDRSNCEVCGKVLSEYRVLRIEIGHAASGKPLSKLWYRVPLCQEHGSGTPLDVVMEWEKEPEPRS